VPWEIALTFSGPYKPRDVPQPYPAPVTDHRAVIPGEVATKLSWTDAQGLALPASKGVYIVENLVENHLEPVYAGQAANRTVLERYFVKAAGVHELGLSCASSQELQNQQVWVGTLVWRGTRLRQAIDMVEHWLIRYLLIRDFELSRKNNSRRKILNNRKTGEGRAPGGGMTLAFNTPAGLGYLWDSKLQNLNDPRKVVAHAGNNPNTFSYEYAGGDAF
jgi:hypothetical protein